MSASVPTLGEPKVVYGREAYIPEWAPATQDLSLVVRYDGKPLHFTIGDMLPERRWCVTETGDLMNQRDFEERFKMWRARVVRDGRILSIQSANRYWDPNLDPVPNVRAFASVTHDWQGKEIRIGFNPNKPATAREEQVQTAVPVATGTALRGQLEVLNELKERGVLSDEQFAGEVSRVLTGPKPEPPAGPPEGFSSLSAEEVAKDEMERTARCGKLCASKAGRVAHERHCETCSPPPTLDAA